MLPVLVNQAVGKVTPHLASFGSALKKNNHTFQVLPRYLRVELKDFKELVHCVGVGEGKEEADLDDGDA